MRGVTEATGETVHSLAEDIASPTARVLSAALAFLALFIGCVIVLSLLTALLDLLFRMPVLNKANVFLGVVFGVAEAVVFVLVLSIALSVLVRSLGAIDPNLFGDEVVENTVVCRFVLEHNPLQQLYEVLK